MESTTAYSNEFLMAAAPGKLGHEFQIRYPVAPGLISL